MDVTVSLIGQAIVFVLLVLFTAKFVWPPLMAVIAERRQQIEAGLSAADRARRDLELAEQKAGEVLQEARQRASDILAQAEKRAHQIVEEAKDHGRQESDWLLAGARAEVEQQVHQAREVLRRQIAQLVVQGAEQILQKEIDASRHADLLSRLQTELRAA